MKKVAETGIAGRDKLIAGVNYLVDAVKLTYGPYGQNFAIEKGNRITNDGITIARELVGTQDDPFMERGLRIGLEAISKSNDEVGDGSTTCAIFLQSVLKESSKYLKKDGLISGKKSPTSLVRQIEEERLIVNEKMVSRATPITSEQELVDVATASVEDEELGRIIGEAQWKLGPEGVLLAEEVTADSCSVEYVKGIYVDNGFGTSMIINNAEKEALELTDVRVLLTNHTISSLDVLMPVLEGIAKLGKKDVVIVARAFTEEAIRQCIKNMENGFSIYPLNAPYTDQAEIMKDLVAVLGGRFISTENDTLDSIQLSDVGFATRVFAKRSTTVFTGEGKGVEERVATLEQKRDGSGSDFEKKNIATRIAQLRDGFARIRIGGKTITERQYRKDKADDAVNSVRAALQEGVIRGGGVELKEIAEELPDDSILRPVLLAPHQQIMANAGENFDVPSWVKDSVKVNRVALEKACSVAGTLVTAAGVITTKKEDECCHKKA